MEVYVNNKRIDAKSVKVFREKNCWKEIGTTLNAINEFAEPKHNDHHYIKLLDRKLKGTTGNTKLLQSPRATPSQQITCIIKTWGEPLK